MCSSDLTLQTATSLTRQDPPTYRSYGQAIKLDKYAPSYNATVNKESIQLWSFSNYPGAYFIDAAWPADRVTVEVDGTNVVDEIYDGTVNNTSTY